MSPYTRRVIVSCMLGVDRPPKAANQQEQKKAHSLAGGASTSVNILWQRSRPFYCHIISYGTSLLLSSSRGTRHRQLLSREPQKPRPKNLLHLTPPRAVQVKRSVRLRSIYSSKERCHQWILGPSTKTKMMNGAGEEQHRMGTLLLRQQKAIKTVPIVSPMHAAMVIPVLDPVHAVLDSVNQGCQQLARRCL